MVRGLTKSAWRLCSSASAFYCSDCGTNYLAVTIGNGVQLKDRGQMTYEERLEAAERHRLTGNGLFQEVRTYLSGASCLLLPGLACGCASQCLCITLCLLTEGCATA